MKIGDYNISKLQILIIGVLVVGLVIGVYLVQTKQIFKSRAGARGPFDVSQNNTDVCDGNNCTIHTLDTITIKPVTQ